MQDEYGRKITYLRLSVTERCNLRCRYCMPENGICKKQHSQMLTEEEMISAVEVAAALGVSKLRITGGEPLVKRNIVSICEKTSKIPGISDVAITTNGTLLPQLADALRNAGVKRVNISLDTLNADKYAYITRIGTLDKALEGIQTAISAGFEKIKINTVLIGGFNDDEIVELAGLTRQYPVDVRFIELMPMYDSGDFLKSAYIPCSEVLEKLPQAVAQPNDGGVAKLFRLPNSFGNIGLISPVSDHFCKECNRIRMTADGKIKPCLHSATEYTIKGLDKEAMREVFQLAIRNKPSEHELLSYESRSDAGRNMNQIGG